MNLYNLTEVERAFAFGYLANPDNDPLNNKELQERWSSFKDTFLLGPGDHPKVLKIVKEMDTYTPAVTDCQYCGDRPYVYQCEGLNICHQCFTHLTTKEGIV